jgi:hypothetical protein
MREATIVRAIKVQLLKAGWFVFKIHGGPLQIAGMPDLLCLRAGVYVWLEVKGPDGRLSNRQQWIHEFLRGKGADVRVVRGVDELGDMCTASSTTSTPSAMTNHQDSASSSAPCSTET